MTLVVANVGALYTLSGLADAGGRAGAHIKPCPDAAVVSEGGLVTFAGPRSELPPELSSLVSAKNGPPDGKVRRNNPYPPPPEVIHHSPALTLIDARGALVTPGLVDAHTHAVYGGERSSEMALKLAGVPYLEILERGGGILSTVKATREASDDELYEAASVRLKAMLAMGTTTVEAKSGYGLSTDHELRLLRIIADLSADLPLRIVPTFLGAHAVPKKFRSNPEAYVDEIIERMLPAVARQGIAKFCDVFCESRVFSAKDSIRILETAAQLEMYRKVHADEIDTSTEQESGAAVAARAGAVSADHLRSTGPPGMRLLAKAGTIPVLLPATTFCLREPKYADARTMIDEFDLPVALATDCNPGTSPTESLPLVMALAALHLRMSPEEILAGMTICASRALCLHEVAGSLEPGKAGDLVIWQAYDLALLPYRLGADQASLVIAGGEIVTAH